MARVRPAFARYGISVSDAGPRPRCLSRLYGAVRDADHATIALPFWHRVLMNRETQNRTMNKVASLD